MGNFKYRTRLSLSNVQTPQDLRRAIASLVVTLADACPEAVQARWGAKLLFLNHLKSLNYSNMF